MKVWLPFLLSFFCVVDVQHLALVQQDVQQGCEVFAVWENAQKTPRYWFLHCPDESRSTIQSDGVFMRQRGIWE